MSFSVTEDQQLQAKSKQYYFPSYVVSIVFLKICWIDVHEVEDQKDGQFLSVQTENGEA